MKAAIVGASGYSGEALVRLLSLHPKIEELIVTSRSLVGTRLSDHMPAMRHIVGDLTFSESDPTALAARQDVELFFLALPHGVAHSYAEPLFAAGKTIIDLSADFRLNSTQKYAQYYGQAHPAPELLKSTPYVLPEQELEKAAFADVIVQFNPHLAPINRGIATTIVAKAKHATIDTLYSCWEKTYQASPFVSLLPSGTFPNTQAVAGSNRADLAAVYNERTDHFVITSCIDNLVKGASGQAVQIMNLKYGFDESCGLL